MRATFTRLHAEGERAVAENLVARGWQIRAEPAEEARGFWAAMFGVALESACCGEAFNEASAEATVKLVLNLYTEPDHRSYAYGLPSCERCPQARAASRSATTSGAAGPPSARAGPVSPSDRRAQPT